MEVFIAWGVPSAITGLIFGILLYLFKRDINKKDKEREKREERREREREEREKNTEKLMLMIMQNGRAAVVLAEATARAVQRIPDAHCNGDMTEALRRAEEIQKETLKRAWRTFLQVAISYIAANLCVVDFTATKDVIFSAVMGLVVSAGAAGIAAVMNLEKKHVEEVEENDEEIPEDLGVDV